MKSKIIALQKRNPECLSRVLDFCFESQKLLNLSFPSDMDFLRELMIKIGETVGNDELIIYYNAKHCYKRYKIYRTHDGDYEFTILSDISKTIAPETFYCIKPDSDLKSVVFGILSGKERYGQIKYVKDSGFSIDDFIMIELITIQVGETLRSHITEMAIKERVKELGGLYKMSEIATYPDITIEGILQSVVNILPPAWQYPEITEGRVLFDAVSIQTEGFSENGYILSAPIKIGKTVRGELQVVYTEDKKELDEGPFLIEERHLINSLARQLSIVLERKEELMEKEKLKEQLRHADRLATIGQLSSGIAHELNEPLSSILGFSQLIKKNESLSDQGISDIERVEKTALFAREIVKKLLIFARQDHPRMANFKLNETVEQSLSLLRTRLSRDSIETIVNLSGDLPAVYGDAAQIQQVIINLLVNAYHAMPDGGTLFVKTWLKKHSVCLSVKDTGIGMNNEVIKQIFIPFFTTKEVDKGTGLGLSVVHGIVSTHKGKIDVNSKEGIGSEFIVSLPVSVMS